MADIPRGPLLRAESERNARRPVSARRGSLVRGNTHGALRGQITGHLLESLPGARTLLTPSTLQHRRGSLGTGGSPVERRGSFSAGASSAERRRRSLSTGAPPAVGRGSVPAVPAGKAPSDLHPSSHAGSMSSRRDLGAAQPSLRRAGSLTRQSASSGPAWPTSLGRALSSGHDPIPLDEPSKGKLSAHMTAGSMRWVVPSTKALSSSPLPRFQQERQDGRTSPTLQRLGIRSPIPGVSALDSARFSSLESPIKSIHSQRTYRFTNSAADFGRAASASFGRSPPSPFGRVVTSPTGPLSSASSSPRRKMFHSIVGNASFDFAAPNYRSPGSVGTASPTRHRFRSNAQSSGVSRLSSGATAGSVCSMRSNQSSDKNKITEREEVLIRSEEILRPEKLHLRMKQLDSIISRKADKVLFSMKSTHEEESFASIAKKTTRKLKIAKEMLVRVKKRRLRKQAYMYAGLFFAFFALFLLRIYMRNISSISRMVRQSIGTKLSSTLPPSFLQSEDNFYDWLDALVLALFPSPKCGDGVCDPSYEFPKTGELGCQEDCGMNSETTRVKVRLKFSWQLLPGNGVSSIVEGSEDGLGSLFSYNLWSETLGGYIFADDSSDLSDELSLPDGKYRLELYHNTISPSMSIPFFNIGPVSGLAPSTVPVLPQGSPVLSYGFPGDIVRASLAVSSQIKNFCTGQLSFPIGSVCDGYDTQKTYKSLMAGYGLGGCLSVSMGLGASIQERERNLVCFNHCTAPDVEQFTAADFSVDPSLCSDALGNPTPGCKNATALFADFRCQSSYEFELWEFGPPRNMSMGLNKSMVAPRFLTAFNVLLGGLVITQRRRKNAPCPPQPTSLFDVLSVFPCHMQDPDQPFGTDAAFISSSKLFTGKASSGSKYTLSEMRNDSSRAGPFGFFPHQWGQGCPKQDQFVVPVYIGSFPLFLDGSLSPDQAARLAAYVRDANFFDRNTQSVRVDLMTFNKPFTVLSVSTVEFVRDYGGNTRWKQRTATIALNLYTQSTGPYMYTLDLIFIVFLLFDVWHNAFKVFLAYRREEMRVYRRNPLNYFAWLHIVILFSIFVFEAAVVVQSSAFQLPAAMDVLADLTSPVRPFATRPQQEADVLQVFMQANSLDERIKFLTAVQVMTLFCFVIRLVGHLHFQPRLATITRTLSSAGQDLVHFILVFLFLLVCYGTVAVILVGHLVEPFQTLPSAMQYLAFTCLGWHDTYEQLMAAKKSNQNDIWSLIVFQVFYWSWLIMSTFLMLNFLLSIMVAAYSQTRSQKQQGETMAAEIWSFLSVEFRIFFSRMYGYTPMRDKHVEKSLMEIVEQGQRIQDAQKKLLKASEQEEKKEPEIRVAGGLVVKSYEMASLIEDLYAKGKNLLHSMYDELALNPAGEGEGEGTEEEAGLDGQNPQGSSAAASARKFTPKKSIQRIMERYGTVVDIHRDDEDLLSLLKIEHVNMVLANQVTLMQLSKQVMDVLDMSVGIAEATLLPEDLEAILQSILIKLSMENKMLGDISTLLKASSHTFGSLMVHVQKGRNLPTRHVFASPQLYVALFLKHAQPDGNAKVSPFGKTSQTPGRNKPVWGQKVQHDVVLCAGAELLVYVMEYDVFSGDKCVAHCAIELGEVPIDDQGVEGWFKAESQLRNHAIFGGFGSNDLEIFLHITYHAFDELSPHVSHERSPLRSNCSPIGSVGRSSGGTPSRSHGGSTVPHYMSPIQRIRSASFERIPSDLEGTEAPLHEPFAESPYRRTLYITRCADREASERMLRELGWMVPAVEAHVGVDEHERTEAAERLYGGLVAQGVPQVESRRLQRKTSNIMRKANLLTRTVSAVTRIVGTGSASSEGSSRDDSKDVTSLASPGGSDRGSQAIASKKGSFESEKDSFEGGGSQQRRRASVGSSASVTLGSAAHSSASQAHAVPSAPSSLSDHNPERLGNPLHPGPRQGGGLALPLGNVPQITMRKLANRHPRKIIMGLLEDLPESAGNSIDMGGQGDGEDSGSAEPRKSLTNRREVGGLKQHPLEQRLDFSSRVKPPDASAQKGSARDEGTSEAVRDASQNRRGSRDHNTKQNIVSFFRSSISKYTPTRKASKEENPQEGVSPPDPVTGPPGAVTEASTFSRLSKEYGSMMEFSVHSSMRDEEQASSTYGAGLSAHKIDEAPEGFLLKRRPSFVIIRPDAPLSQPAQLEDGLESSSGAVKVDSEGQVQGAGCGQRGQEEPFMC